MNNNEEQGTTNTEGWYTKNAQKRVTSEYEKKSKANLKSMNLGNETQSKSQFDNFKKARENQMA